MRKTINSITENYRLPLIVSVTGHRDLVKEEVPRIKELVRQFLEQLINDYPNYQITILNPLAEGADQLVANVAVDLNVDMIVPLPKPLAEYRKDFERPKALERFDELIEKASQVFELNLPDDVLGKDLIESSVSNGLPYAQLGIFLSAHCHILLALWDGTYSEELGGTSQVVQFHHDDFIPGVTTKTLASQQMLVDDESDLIYHIVCSRDRVNGRPKNGFQPLDACWFTKDINNPRSDKLPEQHKRIFQRGSEFSDDAQNYLKGHDPASVSLLKNVDISILPVGVESIDKLFTVADGLAIKFKEKSVNTLFVTHCFAFLMGLMFLLYSDYETSSIFMILFAGFFLSATAVHYYAKANGWQRKYLDYRTLAEGLRVQLYWAAAGVSNETKWKFAHDSFLQTQDPEFGWIRNVMRVAGTRCDSNPIKSKEGLNFVLNEWIGDSEGGQLGYYKSVAAKRFSSERLTRAFDRVSVVTSSAIVIVFLLFTEIISNNLMTVLFLVMGITLLLFAIREGYASATAVKELVKQYEFMLRIFSNAKRRISETEDSEEKRQILLALGQSALEEHSDWILMHREKSLDQGEIFRMGS